MFSNKTIEKSCKKPLTKAQLRRKIRLHNLSQGFSQFVQKDYHQSLMRNCQICAFSDHYLIFEHSGQHCVQKIAKKKKSNHLPLLFQKIKERKRNHRPFPTCCTKLQKSLHFRLEMRGTRTQCIDEHGIQGEYFLKSQLIH